VIYSGPKIYGVIILSIMKVLLNLILYRVTIEILFSMSFIGFDRSPSKSTPQENQHTEKICKACDH
jgi:hypothetical protein